MPRTRKFEDFSEATTAGLRETDVQLSAADKRAAQKFRDQRLKQAHTFRRVFFIVAIALAGSAVLTSIAMVVGMTFFGFGTNGQGLAVPIAVAFISGLTVETIGILAVIAGYLYPRGGGIES